MPAPMTATSSPCRSAGIEPRPAGWAIQSSNGNGKSGPKIVTGPSLLRWLTIAFLPDRVAAVDAQVGSVDHQRVVGGQEQRRRRDLLRLGEPADGDLAEHRLGLGSRPGD